MVTLTSYEEGIITLIRLIIHQIHGLSSSQPTIALPNFIPINYKDLKKKKNHQQELGTTVLDRPPDVGKKRLNDDIRGVASPRLITL